MSLNLLLERLNYSIEYNSQNPDAIIAIMGFIQFIDTEENHKSDNNAFNIYN